MRGDHFFFDLYRYLLRLLKLPVSFSPFPFGLINWVSGDPSLSLLWPVDRVFST